MDEWQHMKLQSKDGQLSFYLNDELALQTPFQGAEGKIMGLIFTFSGRGSVDYIRLKSANDSILYGEEFDSP